MEKKKFRFTIQLLQTPAQLTHRLYLSASELARRISRGTKDITENSMCRNKRRNRKEPKQTTPSRRSCHLPGGLSTKSSESIVVAYFHYKFYRCMVDDKMPCRRAQARRNRPPV